MCIRDSIPVDHLLGQNLLANYFNKMGLEDITVVSPDLGSVTRSRKFANQLDGDVPLAIIDKRKMCLRASYQGSKKNKFTIS